MTPLETVNEFIRLVCVKDLDGALALCADDIEYDNVPMGKNHGKEEVRALLGPMIGGVDVEWIVEREAATGNIVMNERIETSLGGLPEADRRRILQDNAAELYGIPV